MKQIFKIMLFLPIFILAQQRQSIIPKPVSLTEKSGTFLIDTNVSLKTESKEKSVLDLTNYFNSAIKSISGIELNKQLQKNKIIELKIQKIDKIGDEGYILNISSSKIELKANSSKGLFYGIQSLLQTLPAIRTNQKLEIPCMEITDYPRFTWRGMHLDVSRHFFGPEVVKEYIDLMAQYKFNVFHWHLVDDQGWRIEIKKYPKLTEIGAWRYDNINIPWRERPQAKEGQLANYGGFYTQEQIKEIIKYAAERQIQILPEIELPGHVASVMASYPELSCTQNHQLSLTGGQYAGISQNFCAGNDESFVFLENVLSEVIDLFPFEYIHIGGDEARKEPWKACSRCQARIKQENLKDEDELQSYFIKRIEKFVLNKNKKMIGWDEILEGGLAESAIVMSWRGEIGGIEAAKMHHPVIMTPETYVYFDHYQGDSRTEPPAIGGFNTLKKVYNYEPIPKELNEQEGKLVLGAQANLWVEFITTPEHLKYMLLPRMLALSEVVWAPKESKNWNDFNARLQKHLKGFDQKSIKYSPGNFLIEIKPISQDNKINVTLDTEIYNAKIHYTLDGTNPNENSFIYENPIEITKTSTLKTVPVVDGFIVGKSITEQKFVIHQAIGSKVTYQNKENEKYPANGTQTLVDGIKGTLNRNSFWHAFTKDDFIATVDLETEKYISNIQLGCLQLYGNWIFMPQWVKFEVSNDGQNYRQIETVKNSVDIYEKQVMNDFSTNFPVQKVRYIKITAKNNLTPPKHSRPGYPAWIFVDEIIVN